ncbi:MAG: two-component sensor histidine kinase [Clostridia bacterium]|nr:two-component sensor histidine kinase [Clostridia bacterium]
MRYKIFKNIFFTAMTSFLLCLTLVVGVLYRHFSDQQWDDLKNESSYLVSAVEHGGTDILGEMTSGTSSRVTLIDTDGTVLFDNVSQAEKMESHSGREEFLQALSSGIGKSSRFSTTLSEKTDNYAVRLADGKVLRVSSIRNTTLTLVADMLFPSVMIIAVAIILSVFFAARLSGSITEPINRIDLDNPDGRDIYDELKPLVDRINTQNKQIQLQINEMKETHEQQDSMRREFTSNVSHELKTPLTSISGTAEMMCSGLIKQEDIPHFAENIYKESQRLIVLVGDLMKLSQMDEGAVSFSPEPVDLYDICADVISGLSGQAQKKNITFTLDGSRARVSGSEKIIDEMVYNLCDNAIKYNRENGEITVRLAKDDDRVILTVADTGIGIPRDALDRIFERFYRVDKSHSRAVNGTGLGLAIVKHGALLHDAEISVDSELGKGTSISIAFKAADTPDFT